MWLLDRGCNNHTINNKNLVANLDQFVKTEVKLGTDKTVEVDGKGVVNILTKQGETKEISELYYVPILKHNLLSVGQLTQKGYKVIFQGQEVVIYDKPPSKQLIEKVQMTRNILFPLILNYSGQASSFTVACSDDYWLWHFRFGHLHFSGLRLLQQKQMVRGLPPIKEPTSTCECYVLEQKYHESFQKGVAY